MGLNFIGWNRLISIRFFSLQESTISCDMKMHRKDAQSDNSIFEYLDNVFLFDYYEKQRNSWSGLWRKRRIKSWSAF